MENNPELSELIDLKLALQKQEAEIDYLRQELETLRKPEALHRQTEAQKIARLYGVISRVALAVEARIQAERGNTPNCAVIPRGARTNRHGGGRAMLTENDWLIIELAKQYLEQMAAEEQG